MNAIYDTVKVGDEIVVDTVRGSYNSYRLMTVTRVLKSRIETEDGRKWSKKDGIEISQYKSHRIAITYGHGELSLMTKADLVAYEARKAAERDRIEKVRFITSYLSQNKHASKLSDEKLAEIYALLGGE